MRSAVWRDCRSPARCPICEDERQFVHRDQNGQHSSNGGRSSDVSKTKRRSFSASGWSRVAIGQRALLLQLPGGNLLWDCISLLDDKTIAEVNARGLPHDRDFASAFYSSMVEWADHLTRKFFARRSPMGHTRKPRIPWEGTTSNLGRPNANQLRRTF
jgi:hypothetical protein